jgi:hypothetical protein
MKVVGVFVRFRWRRFIQPLHFSVFNFSCAFATHHSAVA